MNISKTGTYSNSDYKRWMKCVQVVFADYISCIAGTWYIQVLSNLIAPNVVYHHNIIQLGMP